MGADPEPEVDNKNEIWLQFLSSDVFYGNIIIESFFPLGDDLRNIFMSHEFRLVNGKGKKFLIPSVT